MGIHTCTPAQLTSTHMHTHFQVNLGPLVTETSHAGQVSIPAGPLKGASSPAGLLKDLLEEAVAAGREQWPLFSRSHAERVRKAGNLLCHFTPRRQGKGWTLMQAKGKGRQAECPP